MPYSFKSIGELAIGTETVSFPGADRTQEPAICGVGRTFILKLDVPEQQSADGAMRAGMVLRLRVDAAFPVSVGLATAGCELVDATACAVARDFGSEELLLPLVAPGEYRVLLTTDTSSAEGGDVTLVVEQVRCPAGFVPDGETCLGFVHAGETTPRIEHSVSTLDGGEVMILGGRDAEGDAIASYDLITSSAVTTLPYSFPIAGHATARLRSGGTLAVGGGSGAGADGIVSLFRPGQPTPVWLYTGRAVLHEAAGCSIASLTDREGALIICPGGERWLVLPTDDTIFGCYSDSDCRAGEACVADFNDGIDERGICVCDSETCFLDELDTQPAIYPVAEERLDVPTAQHFLLPMPLDDGALLVAGGVGTQGAPARPHQFSVSSRAFLALDALEALPDRLRPIALSLGDEALMVGGRAPDGSPARDGFFIDPRGAMPVRSFQLASARADAAAVVIDADRALIIGGDDGRTLLESTEIIDRRSTRARPGPLLPHGLASAHSASAPTGAFVVGGRTTQGASGAIYQLVRIAPTMDSPADGRLQALEGDSCAAPLVLFGEGTYTGSTFGLYHQLDEELIGGCSYSYLSRGPDAVHMLEVPARTSAVVTATPTGVADVVVYVVDGCAPGAACLAHADEFSFPGQVPEVVQVPAAGDARTVFIVVDAHMNTHYDYTLDVAFEAE